MELKIVINKIKQKIFFYKEINIRLYLKLNYFCENIIRVDHSRIIPYKGTIVDIAPTAKIYLSNGNIELGCNKLKGSKAETYIRLRENAIWSSCKGCKISYGSTIEILASSLFDTSYFTMNSNSVVIAAEKIEIGQDVMIGRNVVVYDSDFHDVVQNNGTKKIKSLPVTIGNHVWITSNVTILKGVIIGDNSIISSNSLVKHNVNAESIYDVMQEVKVRERYGEWLR